MASKGLTAKEKFLRFPKYIPKISAGNWFYNFDVHETGEFSVHIGYENGDSGILECVEMHENFNTAFETCVNEVEKELKLYGAEL